MPRDGHASINRVFVCSWKQRAQDEEYDLVRALPHRTTQKTCSILSPQHTQRNHIEIDTGAKNCTCRDHFVNWNDARRDKSVGSTQKENETQGAGDACNFFQRYPERVRQQHLEQKTLCEYQGGPPLVTWCRAPPLAREAHPNGDSGAVSEQAVDAFESLT